MLSGEKTINSIAQKVTLFDLYYDCQLMHDYLARIGKIVPENIVNDLAEINDKTHLLFLEYNEKKKQRDFSKEVEYDYKTKIAKNLEADHEKISRIFNKLTKLVKPASPCTLENTLPSWKIFVFFGPKSAPFACYMYWNGIIYLLGYILTGLLVGFAEENNFIYKFTAQAILFFSAGLGGSLYALITSRTYLINRTFNNKYFPHYINRILVGIITGFILANLVVPSDFAASKGMVERLTPSMLALLGGFSADAVIQILKRLVATIGTVIEGDSKDIIEIKEQKIKIKMNAEQLKQNMEYLVELQLGLDLSGLNKNSTAYKKFDNIINIIKKHNEHLVDEELVTQ